MQLPVLFWLHFDGMCYNVSPLYIAGIQSALPELDCTQEATTGALCAATMLAQW